MRTPPPHVHYRGVLEISSVEGQALCGYQLFNQSISQPPRRRSFIDPSIPSNPITLHITPKKKIYKKVDASPDDAADAALFNAFLVAVLFAGPVAVALQVALAARSLGKSLRQPLAAFGGFEAAGGGAAAEEGALGLPGSPRAPSPLARAPARFTAGDRVTAGGSTGNSDCHSATGTPAATPKRFKAPETPGSRAGSKASTSKRATSTPPQKRAPDGSVELPSMGSRGEGDDSASL